MPLDIIRHLLPRQVWKTRAIAGPDLIDGTHISLEVQELAGVGGIHPISLLIQVQPFFFESRLGHAQVRGDALDIGRLESGRHLLAAIGAGETVYLLPNLFVQFSGQGIQFAGRIFFDAGEKAAETGFIPGYFLSEGTEVDGFHA